MAPSNLFWCFALGLYVFFFYTIQEKGVIDSHVQRRKVPDILGPSQREERQQRRVNATARGGDVFEWRTVLNATTMAQYFSSDHSRSPLHLWRPPVPKRYDLGSIPTRPDVFILSISSGSRRALQAAQRASFGKYFPIIFIEESHTPRCMRCGYQSADMVDEDKLGWSCAQQRNLQGIRLFLSQWHLWVQDLKWLLVIDDDTFVNGPALMRAVDGSDQRVIGIEAQRAPNVGVVVGHRHLGGAGFLVNRRALRLFLDPAPLASTSKPKNWTIHKSYVWETTKWMAIETLPPLYPATLTTRPDAVETHPPQLLMDRCIDLQFGGNWCAFPSDWAVADCILRERDKSSQSAKSSPVLTVRLDKSMRQGRRGLPAMYRLPPFKQSLLTDAFVRFIRDRVITQHYMQPREMVAAQRAVEMTDAETAAGTTADM